MSSLPSQHLRLHLSRFAELSDADQSEVVRRKSLIDSWRNMCAEYQSAGHTRADATVAFLAMHADLSRATLYRWAKHRDGDDPADLLDGRKVDRVANPNVRALISDEAWLRFKELWLDIRKPSTKYCWSIVHHEAGQHGWSWPSLKTVQRRIARDLPPSRANYWRLGAREWARKHAPKLTRNYPEVRAGQHYVGDCHPADVFCRVSDTDDTIVRPTLSAFTDLRTRAIVGWHIGLHENADAVLLAFKRACLEWGIPDEVTIDNGKPYRAGGVSGGWHQDKHGRWKSASRRKLDDGDVIRMSSVFGGLETLPHFAIPYNPDSKPIERVFGTVERQFGVGFPSYCGHDQDDLFKAACQFAQSHPEKCPTVDELIAKWAQYVEAYNHYPHTGRDMHGLSPAQAFAQFEPIAKKILPEGAFDILIMRTTKPVRVTCHGVRYLHDDYGARNPRLQLLQGQEVLLRVHPVDAGSVIVCDLQGKPLCEAINNKRLYSGVTQEDIADGMKARARARRLAKECRDGALRPMLQDTTDAAIAARLAAGRKHAEQTARKTGTDDQPVRGVRPLRSDMTQAIDDLQRSQLRGRVQGSPPDRGPSFEDAVEELTRDDADAGRQASAWADLEDLA